jgi:hypothetical protein
MKHIIAPPQPDDRQIEFATDMRHSFRLEECVLIGPSPETSVQMRIVRVVTDINQGTQHIELGPCYEPQGSP